MMFQLKNISNSIYASFWYEQDIKIQKVLLLVMMQAQRQQYMSMSGIAEMNVDILSSVRLYVGTLYSVETVT